MSDHLSREEMKEYVEAWWPAENSSLTTNGVTVDFSEDSQALEIPAKYVRDGWVIDKIHWDTHTLHMVPREALDDE